MRAWIRLAPCKSPLGSPALKKSRIDWASLPDGHFSMLWRKPGPDRAGCRFLALWRRSARGKAWQTRRRGDLAVAESCEHLQDLAPGRERAAVVALILVHRLHERDFLVRVIALAGGWVDLPAALAGPALFRRVRLAALHCNGDVPFAAIGLFAIRSSVLAHRRRPHKSGTGLNSRPS